MGTQACAAMVLAGGRGERLGALTRYCSKPAVHFGINNRLIDFTLDNCIESGISSVGILSQYFSTDLYAYIGEYYSAKRGKSRIHMLPSPNTENLYRGTADAVYKNIEFIDKLDPEDILVLASDHVYKMDYNEIIDFHRKTGASATIAGTSVLLKDVSKFGNISADKYGRVCHFEEKPAKPRSLNISMGIYVFKWSVLKNYLLTDSMRMLSSHDFGKDILPNMLHNGEPVYTYKFRGYWRDVGTIDGLWEANMECISGDSGISGEAEIFGKTEHSVISGHVTVGTGSEIIDSVIMPGVYIGANVRIYNSIVGANAMIMDNTVIGTSDGDSFFVDRKMCSRGISLIAPWLYIHEGMRFQNNSHIYKEWPKEQMACADMESGMVCQSAGGLYAAYSGQRASYA